MSFIKRILGISKGVIIHYPYLNCPFCGGGLTWTDMNEHTDIEEIRWILVCDCGKKYNPPMVDLEEI
jgi:hypothetical protein